MEADYPSKKTQKDKKKIQDQKENEIGYEVNFSAEFENLEETTQAETEKKQSNQSEEDPNLRHYIIPGTMFEGQFQYVTKQKKEEEVQQMLKQLQNEKRQLQISTEHYVIPSSIVQGQVKKAVKQLKEEKVQKDLQKIDQVKKITEQAKEVEQRPKVIHRVNLHQFNSNKVPDLHQQDIPINLQPVQVEQNFFQAIQQPKMKSIKLLKPVDLNAAKLEKSNVPKLNPVSINNPTLVRVQDKAQSKKRSEEPKKHQIIPGTCFQGQFTYVTKEKKQDQVEETLKQLENEKRQLEFSTEHYENPNNEIQRQAFKADKRLQKKEIIQKEIQGVDKQNNKGQKKRSYKYKYVEKGSNKIQQQNADTEGLKLVKYNIDEKNIIKMEIRSDEKTKVPYKIDDFTRITVMSKKQDQSPFLFLPFEEQPNDDVQIIMLETTLNKKATSPKDLMNQKPQNVLSNEKMSEILSGLKNTEGSPIKVMVGTKQFANYPGQFTPSPSIIDQDTLLKMRIQNQSQFIQKHTHTNQMTAVGIEAQNNEEGNPEEVEINRIDAKQKTTEVSNGKKNFQVQHLHVTMDVDRIKKVEPKDDKKGPFLPKLVKSALFSSLVGGLAWLSLEDKKVAAISAATGLALGLIIQK